MLRCLAVQVFRCYVVFRCSGARVRRCYITFGGCSKEFIVTEVF